jgi:rare lipoprotein A
MANGETLNDEALTVAFNRAPLNSYVTITNDKTGRSVRAKVTDTGGFERHGKIIDLTIATRDAIGCGDVCRVIVSI